MLAALNHPNILTIHEVGDSAGIPYISTEFIDGVTIRDLIRRQELSLAEVLDIAEQVASGLAAAHAAGIVHRDIKPENIMRRTDGLVKILDFGIAKLMEPEAPDPFSETQARTHTEAGLVMGTANYMSPEQARALPVDERTDIWSLGVVLYELLAQRLPFKGDTRMDTMVAILDRDPAPLCEVAAERYSVSLQLQQTVDKCLRKDMSERYRAANELLADLKSLATNINNVEPLVKPATQTAATVSRHLNVWPLLGVVALLISVLAGTFLYRRSVAQSQSVVPIAPEAAATKLYSQMSEAEQLKFVDEQEQRISTMMGDRPVKLNDDAVQMIKHFVDRYAARNGASEELGHERLSAVYERARPYVPLIAREFAARKVPVIIGIYLPVIESAYRDCFENNVGAKGLYQFLPQTAEQYGVARRDMCDVDKMTPAAAHYIADRMAELGEDSQSLTLVLVSYNHGPEWVRNTLRELRGTEHFERNFWTLFAHRDELDEGFRTESAYYVPNFFAAAIIGENPEAFDLPLPPLSSLAETK